MEKLSFVLGDEISTAGGLFVRLRQTLINPKDFFAIVLRPKMLPSFSLSLFAKTA